MIRVLIVDDNALVRKSYRALLQREQNIEIVGEAQDGIDAIDCARDSKPDVILMDIRMPRMDGLRAVAQIKSLGLPCRVVIVSLYADETWVRAAFDRGARGFVLKEDTFAEMTSAIQTVAEGGAFLSPHLTQNGATQQSSTALSSPTENCKQ